MKCENCSHAEMCKWIDELEGRGCDFCDEKPCELLILKSDILLYQEDKKKWAESIKQEKKNGVIILPPYFTPLLIPNDVEIRIEQEPCEWGRMTFDATSGTSVFEFSDGTIKQVKQAELEQCEDAISREELLKAIKTWDKFGCDADTKLVRYQDHYIPYIHYDDVIKCIKGMPSVTQKSGKCKNCKYFELDHWCEINGVPMICAHEICTKWCSGVQTSSDGYCHLFEPQESEDKE